MQVLYENIPAMLKGLDRWVVWQYEERNGKMTKPPYVPASGKGVTLSSMSAPHGGRLSRQKTPMNPGVLTGSGLYWETLYSVLISIMQQMQWSRKRYPLVPTRNGARLVTESMSSGFRSSC